MVNNNLILPNVGRQDSGEYICSATNTMGTSEVTITLDVECECLFALEISHFSSLVFNYFFFYLSFVFLLLLAPPYATSVPDNVAVRVGEVIRLQCLAHGTPPLTYTWTKLNGNLPPRAHVSGGDLQIDLASPEDGGSYKCTASNNVGNSEVIAKVTIRCKFLHIRLNDLQTDDRRILKSNQNCKH